jgi:hypothetical protein
MQPSNDAAMLHHQGHWLAPQRLRVVIKRSGKRSISEEPRAAALPPQLCVNINMMIWRIAAGACL